MAFSLQEWGVILAVVILLFGATAIPKIARALGRAKGEFKKARHEFDAEAAKAEAAAAAGTADEESVRRTARELGIEEKGKDLAEVRRLVQERLA